MMELWSSALESTPTIVRQCRYRTSEFAARHEGGDSPRVVHSVLSFSMAIVQLNN